MDAATHMPGPAARPDHGAVIAGESALLPFAQVLAMDGLEGRLRCHARYAPLVLGDVLLVRERSGQRNGLIVQVIGLSRGSVRQVDEAAAGTRPTWPLAGALRGRSNGPEDQEDAFLLTARVRVRAAVVGGLWVGPNGRVPAGPVDVIRVGDAETLERTVVTDAHLALHIGDYHGYPIRVYGGAFEKISLITGAKGGGKSHLAKGLMAESVRLGVSAIAFDINDEYGGVAPDVRLLRPGINLKLRLDTLGPDSFLRILAALAPLPERTNYVAQAALPSLFLACSQAGHVPDLGYLSAASARVVPGTKDYETHMRSAYERSLATLGDYRLIMDRAEARAEAAALAGQSGMPPVMSLATALQDIFAGRARTCVMALSGLPQRVQQVVVGIVLDYVESICRRQAAAARPAIYPWLFFEEAHMYLDGTDLEARLTLARHTGLSVCLVSNSPGALPDAVFRLLDNLVLLRLASRREIDRLADCGLTDAATLAAFAENLPDHHALLLSAPSGATRGFPLAFHVRDFGLPESGATRSQWAAMRARPP